MSSEVPFVTFNNGVKCPILGLGTWQANCGEVGKVVSYAIDVGYRHIDCALVYGNEKEIGDALKKKIEGGDVKREDLFITSKLWNTHHRPDVVEKTVRVTLSNLQLQYIDLYLIHWPMAFKEGDDAFPVDENGKVVYSDVDYVDTWKAMEKLVELGLVKSIGISNFNSKQIDRVLKIAKIKPVTNQVECHPYLAQVKLLEFCKARGIELTAYSPLGSPHRPWAKSDEPNLLEDATIKSIATKYKKSVAQVLIRYSIDRGIIVIPKSSTQSRITDNFNIFDFALSQEDIALITSLDCNGRVMQQSEARDHKDHPFANDEF